jgi:radical SAM superfamily enzyme YgiQ (UPF0313 family)
VKVLLISTYELGHQPFGVASPAAWLRKAGCEVTSADLAIERLAEDAVRRADLVAFYVPMHTATRIATRVVGKVRKANPGAHICFYGLYAPVNERYLRKMGGRTILGGEFEQGLLALVKRLSDKTGGDGEVMEQSEPLVSLDRQRFLVPDRSGLPPVYKYATLQLPCGATRIAGYTEASRGCKYSCRHCPIVPVYRGKFRIVEPDVVLADIRQQIAAGARHVTFGDPDFLNGPTHATTIVDALHREFPDITYDVTIKVEHLLQHRDRLSTLRDSGCLFVTTAVESVDDCVLEHLDKRHTRSDFVEAVRLTREIGLELNPTFVPFTPWIRPSGYVELLETVIDLGLVDNVSPIQYAIRLLIPASSRLLELEEVRGLVGELDDESLAHPWTHPDPSVDRLQQQIFGVVHEGERRGETRREMFRRIWRLASEVCAQSAAGSRKVAAMEDVPARATVPYLTEPWYC